MTTNKHELHLLKPWKRWLFFFERRLVVPISPCGRSQQPTYQYRLARRS